MNRLPARFAFFLIFPLVLTLFGCEPPSEIDSAPTPSLENPLELIRREQNFFTEEAIRDAAECALGKPIEKRRELSELADLDTLFLEEPVEDFGDVARYMPNLTFLSANVRGDLSDAAYGRLASLKHLKGLCLYASGALPALDFARGLPYLELGAHPFLQREAVSSVAITDRVGDAEPGNITNYVRLQEGSLVYELFVTNTPLTQDADEVLSKLIISRRADDGYAHVQTLDVPKRMAHTEGGLYTADVNFDGETDILVLRGNFGTQGMLLYDCFLNVDDQYVYRADFGEIPNASISAEHGGILSSWRNFAASNSWAVYDFRDDEFIMTEQLTFAPDESFLEQNPDYDEPIPMVFVEEGLLDGVWGVRRTYAAASVEEKPSEYYGEGTHWALNSQKWNSFRIDRIAARYAG